VCPRCEGKARRVFHAAPIIFKGSGFYVTDHRPSQAKNPASEPSGSKAEAPASKSTSESAPAKS
jgi:predicted nucleic acid-binding Zn ribbon protein